MVWAYFQVTLNSRVGRSPLIIIERDSNIKRNRYTSSLYIETLERGLLSYYRPRQIFQQDNALIYNTNHIKEQLEKHGVWIIKWPPYLPDLNPIEHLWWALKRIVYKLYPELAIIGKSEADLERLRKALKKAWKKLPNSLLWSLIWSILRRLKAIRKAKGQQTKY